MSSTEATEAYRSQRKLARRYVSEHGSGKWGGCLPVLEVIMPGVKEMGTVSLGLIDVPLQRVRGTLASGRAAALAGNFLPLLPESSEFAAKWISLYASHMKEGIRDPGTAYEYLGYYYIVEGHKRVSVLTAAGASSVQLDVQRVIPPDSDDDEVLIYKEFLNVDNRINLHGMWFSKHGSFTELYGISQREKGENPDDWMFDAFFDFRMCYHDLGFDAIPMTTGDAFLEFVRVFGIPYRWEHNELKTSVKCMERQFLYVAGTPSPQISPSTVNILTNESEGISTLKQQLKQSDALYFLLSRTPRNDILPTFYGRMDEPALVLGALAGALTRSGVVGWIDGEFLDDSAAFEQGVRMVGARNSVVKGATTEELNAYGVDMALMPYTGEDEQGPGFPGIYARLAGLTNGYVNEYYAASAWDFDAFHKLLTTSGGGPLDGRSPASEPLHIVLGLDSGLLKLHLNRAVLPPLTVKLADIVRNAFHNVT